MKFLEKLQDTIGFTDSRWFNLNAPGTEIPRSHPFLEFLELPLCNILFHAALMPVCLVIPLHKAYASERVGTLPEMAPHQMEPGTSRTASLTRRRCSSP